MTRAITLASALAVVLHVADAEAAVVEGRVIAIEGATPAGATTPVSNVLQPFVIAVGDVAFAATLGSGESALVVGEEIAWLSSDELVSVTAVQNSVGADGADAFVLRATVDGEAGLWTRTGALGRVGDPAPGFPLFPTAAFVGTGDCTMDGTGAIYWRGNVDITNDGFADVGGLFRAPDGAAGSIEALHRSGGMVDGVTLHGGTSAVVDEFSISDDGAHVVARLNAAGDTFADQLVVLDDEILVREGDVVPSFPFEHWRALDLVSVNESGNVLFTGNTDASAAVDEFVAYDGDIEVHEGDVLDGVQVAFDLRFVALNDRNNAAIGWATNDGGSTVEIVFIACDAADIAGTAEVLVTVGDALDVDGDGIGDFTVADVVGVGNEASRVLGDREAVFLELDLDPNDLNAIVEIPFTCCGNGVTDGGEECDDGNEIGDDACTNDCMLPPDVGTTSDSSGEVGTSSGSTGDATEGSSSASTETSTSGSSSASTGVHATEADATGSSSTGADSEDTGTTEAQSSSADATTTGRPDTSDGSGDTTGTGSTGSPATTGTDDDGGMTAGGDGCGCATSRSRVSLVGLSVLLLLGLRRRRAWA